MNQHHSRPPLPLRLTARLLPEDAREEILGDLIEHWRREVSERRRLVRIAWAWRQPLVALVSRLRFGTKGTARPRPRPRVAVVRRWGLGVSTLDVKLALRMLVKHPAITFVVVLALGLGIPVSLAPHHLLDAITNESPPFEQGERVVGLVWWNLESASQEFPTLGDFEFWRDELTTLASIGAAAPRRFNVITDDGQTAPVRGAMMTASSFALTRVPPLLGRTLLESDEVQGAPEVAVIGNDLWQSRLGGRADVIGSRLRIAGVSTTVVGVMPAGFAFPNTEQLWMPLRLDASDFADGLGPLVWVVGRLADGVSKTRAQAELRVVGRRAVTAGTSDSMRPEVVSFSGIFFGPPRGILWVYVYMAQALPLLLLAIACGNVAILLLARTANRAGEIAIRTALGASRTRIVGQLFVETLVLALLATGVGLLLLDAAMARFELLFEMPFWLSWGVTGEVVLKALLLAVFSAVVAGVLPALRVTGSALHKNLQYAATRGAGVRFGPVAGALIVVEVALGVGALFAGGMTYRILSANGHVEAQMVEADRYLVASINIPKEGLGSGPAAEDERLQVQRVATTHRELARRLGAEPSVRQVTFSDAPPGEERRERRARIDGDGRAHDFGGFPAVVTYVDVAFFEVLGVSPTGGRGFEPRDEPLEPGDAPAAAVVNAKFIERTLGEGNPVGRMLRLTTTGGEPIGDPLEIVGVVPNVEANAAQNLLDGTPVVYLPATPGEINPLTVTVDVGADPLSFAPRLRVLLAETDPTAIVENFAALDDMPSDEATMARGFVALLGVLSAIAILLSTAALYALMSFTVAQRTREIGIRTALGGGAGGIVVTVARRALGQLALGVTLGAGVWVTVLQVFTAGVVPGGDMGRALNAWPLVMLATAGVVTLVGLAACLTPTLRGLRIRPVEALRVDG